MYWEVEVNGQQPSVEPNFHCTHKQKPAPIFSVPVFGFTAESFSVKGLLSEAKRDLKANSAEVVTRY